MHWKEIWKEPHLRGQRIISRPIKYTKYLILATYKTDRKVA